MTRRGRVDLHARLRRLRLTAVPLAQIALAAGLAWWVASGPLIGHDVPFFAPIAALISLGVGLGQRLPRLIELVVGVALGVLIGDLLIYVIGTGTLQLVLVVALAVGVAVFLGGGALTTSQTGSSAVLVATLVPPTEEQLFNLDRFVDALVGGGVAILVSALLLPVNPVTVARRAVDPLLGTLADIGDEIANAIRARDRGACDDALGLARRTQSDINNLHEALEGAVEVSRIAPLRWRKKGALESYLDAAVPIDHIARNLRVLSRHAGTMTSRKEPVPPLLLDALTHVTSAIRRLQDALRRGADPAGARREALEAARQAAAALEQTGGFSGQVVSAQVRSLAVDVLRAAGTTERELRSLLPDLPEGTVRYG